MRVNISDQALLRPRIVCLPIELSFSDLDEATLPMKEQIDAAGISDEVAKRLKRLPSEKGQNVVLLTLVGEWDDDASEYVIDLIYDHDDVDVVMVASADGESFELARCFPPTAWFRQNLEIFRKDLENC